MDVEVIRTKEDVLEVAMASEGVSPKAAPPEILAEVPKSSWSPRTRPTSTKEGPKNKKGK